MFRWFRKSEAELPRIYNKSLRWMHWIQATVAITGLGAVAIAVNTDKTEAGFNLRKKLMFLHKSCGFFIFLTMPFRLYLATTKDRPPHFTKYTIQKIISTGTHVGLHAGLVFMSTTGFLMLLTAGEAWPFFFGSVPNPKLVGVNKDLSNKIREIHKGFGVWWALLIPAHISGVAFHYVQGERILMRMNPFI